MTEAIAALAVALVLAVTQLLREWLDRRARRTGERRTRSEDVSDT